MSTKRPQNYIQLPNSRRKACTPNQGLEYAKLHIPTNLCFSVSVTDAVVFVEWGDCHHASFTDSCPKRARTLFNKFKKCVGPGTTVWADGREEPTAAEIIRKLRTALLHANNLLMDIYNDAPRNSVVFNRFPRLNTTNLSLLADTKPQNEA